MSLAGIETVLDEALAVLKAGMATKLTALEAIFADSVTLTAPSTTTGYWCDVRPPDTESAADFGTLTQPTICLWPLQSAPAGGEDNPNFSGEYAMEHSFVVGVVLRGSTQENAGTLQMRYTRAVVELLAAAASLTCGQCVYRGTDWSERDLTPDKADYTLQGVVSAFAVITYETA